MPGTWIALSLLANLGATMNDANKGITHGRVRSADGVEIAYSASGTGATALVLIHGGLADRTFWAPQLEGLADRYRVVALDLGGHGESGRNRPAFTLTAWARDVRAVVEALELDRIVLVGNSLGGPVALEAAPLFPGKVLGVIGVDTLHDLTRKIDSKTAKAQAETYRRDFQGTCKKMVGALFHPDSQAELHAWAEQRMCATAREVAVSMVETSGDYDMACVARAAGVPIRAINGDLWPTKIEANRSVVRGFEARIMEGAGHYPMLERPVEFNRLLVEVVRSLDVPASTLSR